MARPDATHPGRRDRIAELSHFVSDATSAESGGCIGAPCRQKLPPPPSSCCRRYSAGRPRNWCSTLMIRLDRQRQPLERDRLVAPVELVRLAWGKAHRDECLCRNPRSLVPPGFDEAMHAVMRAIVTATAQLFEQALGRAAFPPRQLRFLLQDLRQDLDPFAQLWHGLNAAQLPCAPSRATPIASVRSP